MTRTHETLTELFFDIADAIREKDGTSEEIVADEFPDHILAIPSGGGEMLKLAPVVTNGSLASAHFVQVEDVTCPSDADAFDTGVSLEGTVPIIEKVEILQNYSASGAKTHAWLGYNLTSSTDGFGLWANTMLRYVCSPSDLIEKSSFGDGRYEFRQTVVSGNQMRLEHSKDGGSWTTAGTVTYQPVESDMTVSIGVMKNNKVSSVVGGTVGIIKIKDHLTGEYVLNYTPMKDDLGHCYLYDDETDELTKLPESWTAGEVVSGGIELTGDGYEPFEVDVPDKQFGLNYKKFFSLESEDVSDLDLGNGNLREYVLYRTFYSRASRLPDIVFGGTTLGQYALCYAFYRATSNADHVDIKMPNITNVGAYALQYAFSTTGNLPIRDILIGDSAHTWTTLGTYAFQYAFQGTSALRDVIVRGIKDVSTTYAFSYAFAGNTSASTRRIDGTLSFPDLETINASNAFQYAFYRRYIDTDNAKVINPFPKLTDVTGGGAFTNLFAYTSAHKNSIYVFPKLKTIGASNVSTVCSSMFAYAYGGWKYCWFPALESIGYTGSSSYQIFSGAFQGTTIANCYQVCFPMLKKINSSSTSTSATYGCFNACSMMQKVWMPMLSQVTGTSQQKNLFNGCTNLKEIHFGRENETYIKGLTGYATKFGASSSAVIYFDCVNRIKVGDGIYFRDGEDYVVGITNETNTSTHEFTHPNDRYAWKDLDGNIVYTMECWTPQVGDSVYDVDDVVVGSISELDPFVDLKTIIWNITEWNHGTITVGGVEYSFDQQASLPDQFIGTTTLMHTSSSKYSSQQHLYVDGVELALDTTITLNSNVTITVAKASCLVEGTLILMADGTAKPIENVVVGDLVQTYGGPAEVVYSDWMMNKRAPFYDEWTLLDEDGNEYTLRTAHQHRFYNVEQGCFAYMILHEGDDTPDDHPVWGMGEHGLTADGKTARLIRHRQVDEECRHFTIFTAGDGSYYADGILSGNRRTTAEPKEGME